jgi:hypothetical protein
MARIKFGMWRAKFPDDYKIIVEMIQTDAM